ncbi:MAG: hypothetical protein KGL39_11420 [Patescibacteria group bacterium]|nr:hypothetical protein [Patescibacteria group bacterium]
MTVPTLISAATLTRPANTTAYSAGDVVSTLAGVLLQFYSPSRNGLIQTARIVDGANVSPSASFELYLFTAAPAARADNAPLALTDAEAATLVGVIPFVDTPYATNAGVGAAGNLTFAEDATMPFALPAGPNFILYGLLVVRNAYIPVSGETFAIQLGVS